MPGYDSGGQSSSGSGGGGDDAAATALQGGNDQQDGQQEPTFFLPPDFPGASDYKPGDTITLKVVGQDKDGSMEVECVHDDGPQQKGEPAWKQDLRSHMAEEGQV